MGRRVFFLPQIPGAVFLMVDAVEKLFIRRLFCAAGEIIPGLKESVAGLRSKTAGAAILPAAAGYAVMPGSNFITLFTAAAGFLPRPAAFYAEFLLQPGDKTFKLVYCCDLLCLSGKSACSTCCTQQDGGQHRQRRSCCRRLSRLLLKAQPARYRFHSLTGRTGLFEAPGLHAPQAAGQPVARAALSVHPAQPVQAHHARLPAGPEGHGQGKTARCLTWAAAFPASTMPADHPLQPQPELPFSYAARYSAIIAAQPVRPAGSCARHQAAQASAAADAGRLRRPAALQTARGP